MRPGLQAGLEEGPERTLGVNQRAGVLEGDGSLAVHEAAHDPVCVIRAGEQRELTQRVEPSLGSQRLLTIQARLNCEKKS